MHANSANKHKIKEIMGSDGAIEIDQDFEDNYFDYNIGGIVGDGHGNTIESKT